MILINVVITSVLYQRLTVTFVKSVLFGNKRLSFPPRTLYDDRKEEDEDDESPCPGGDDHPGLVRQISLFTFTTCRLGVLIHILLLTAA